MNNNTKTAIKLDRRQFLKISALATTSGALMGTSENRSPIKITNKCQRMDQKKHDFFPAALGL